MIQPIGSGRVEGASLGATSAAGGAQQAAAAMSTLTTRIAATITRELGLVSRDAAAVRPALAGDVFGVDALASELANGLGATPTDAGKLTRALSEFASEAAALLGATPHSSVLGRLANLPYDVTHPGNTKGCNELDHALFAIEAAAFRLREDAPWKSDL